MRKIFLILMIITAMVFLLPGCGGKQLAGHFPERSTVDEESFADKDEPFADKEESFSFTDALGNDIKIHNPKRVVALMGSFAETWILAGGELVGVSDDAFDERGLPLSETVAAVGKYNSPNVEAIIALDPDFVILSSETEGHVALQDVLGKAGIPAAYFRVTYFEDYLAMLKIFTEITGRKDLYEKNGAAVGRQIEEIISGIPKQDPPLIAFLITYSGGAVVKDSKSMTGKMLRDMGCENIADKTPSLLHEFSMESMIVADPDYIFVVPMGNDDHLARENLKKTIEANPAWNGLTAVKNNRYLLLPKELFLYKPNTKWGESYAYLSEILYGEK